MSDQRTPLQKILERCPDARGSGSGWYNARCPAHDDQRASFGFRETDDGKVHIRCQAGCDPKEILARLGMTWSDLYPHDDNRPAGRNGSGRLASRSNAKQEAKANGEAKRARGEICSIYDYVDADENILHQTVRFDPKGFSQRHPDGKGGWIWNLQGVACVLYRLPEVIAAIRDSKPVFVVEGEKDADTLSKAGIVATTCAMGAGKWRPEYSETLTDADVVIVPDNDKPGREHSRQVAEALRGKAKRVRILALRGLSDHGDVSDWLASGGTAEELLALAAKVLPERPDSDPDLVYYPLTDLGNAERLLALHGRDIRYVPPWKRWIVWTGTHWARDEDGAVYRLAAHTIRTMAAQFELDVPKGDDPEAIKKARRAHVKSSEGHRKLEVMMEAASRLDGAQASVDELDTRYDLLPALNGTINLRTGELGPHLREHLITHIVPVEYDPEARCPAWDRFMGEVFPKIEKGQPRAPDESLVAYTWRVLGCTLSGDMLERVFFIFHGAGSNGKSVLIETWAQMLGDYAACVDPAVLMDEKHDGAASVLAQLPGKRFVYTGETRKGKRLNVERAKRLSGNDAIQACAKYEMPFVFNPQFTVIMATNHLPEVQDDNVAIWDRIRRLPFAQRFSRDEGEIAAGTALPMRDGVQEELLAEAPGALARAVRGAMEYYATGLGTVGAVAEATSVYRKQSDQIGSFIADRCETGETLECRACDLWKAYLEWSRAANMDPGTQNAFGASLRERGYAGFDRGRKNKAHWRGLTLLPEEEDEESFWPDGYEPGCEG